MATKTFKIGLSNTDKQNMAQDVYERLLALTFPEYDTATSYEVGDFVVYNDQLYKCIGSTSGAWDSTKWQLATLNDLLTDIESAVAFVNDKANVDGNYPTMTVGVADQLSPYDDESGDDQDEPFSFQATGTGNGTQPDFSTGAIALLKEKQGNTVCINQQVRNYNFSDGTDYFQVAGGSASVSNNVFSYTVTNVYNDNYSNTLQSSPFEPVVGHKYLISAYVKLPRTPSSNRFNLYVGGVYIYFNPTANVRTFCLGIATATNNYKAQVHFACNSSDDWQVGDVATVEQFTCIDLTQWFNGNIPQDLLDNPSNFYRYYQGSLAYNTGELVNANGRYIKCIGRQQWDEDWEQGHWNQTTGEPTSTTTKIRNKTPIKIIPNTVYNQINGSNGLNIYFYDASGNYIGFHESSGTNQTFTTPKNASFMNFSTFGSSTTSYGNNITISLYYSGESGYDQYYQYEVLTNNDTGTETLRSAGSVKDYKEPDGTVHRLVGTRAYQSGDENDSSLITDGTTTNYPLETPTTEQGTPFSENLVIDDFGSMDFQGTNGVPQGNLIFYPVDYKAFIDTLYDYTDGTPSELTLNSELTAKFETYLKSLSGYDGTATQVLKNVEGTLTWVTEE